MKSLNPKPIQPHIAEQVARAWELATKLADTVAEAYSLADDARRRGDFRRVRELLVAAVGMCDAALGDGEKLAV